MAAYHLVQTTVYDEEFATPAHNAPRAVESKVLKRISTLASLLVVCTITIVAFAAAHHVLSTEVAYAEDLMFLTPPGSIPKNFTPDERFRLPPSPNSDEAWRGILPNGLGIIQHPALGPESVGLAFVHQLHCLDTIRKNYFAAQSCTATSETDKHTVHCLDYIRQALQCHADTNLEFRKISETGEAGFTGYGEHRCRDFDAVVRFAEEWRVFDGKSEGGEETVREGVVEYDFAEAREVGDR